MVSAVQKQVGPGQEGRDGYSFYLTLECLALSGFLGCRMPTVYS